MYFWYFLFPFYLIQGVGIFFFLLCSLKVFKIQILSAFIMLRMGGAVKNRMFWYMLRHIFIVRQSAFVYFCKVPCCEVKIYRDTRTKIWVSESFSLCWKSNRNFLCFWRCGFMPHSFVCTKQWETHIWKNISNFQWWRSRCVQGIKVIYKGGKVAGYMWSFTEDCIGEYLRILRRLARAHWLRICQG